MHFKVEILQHCTKNIFRGEKIEKQGIADFFPCSNGYGKVKNKVECKYLQFKIIKTGSKNDQKQSQD